MQTEQLLPGVVALVVIFLLPRFAQGPRGLAVVAGAGITAALLSWALARLAPEPIASVVYLVAGAAAILALFLGILLRGVVLIGKARGWPAMADLVLTVGGVVLLTLSFLRLFMEL